MTTRKPAVSGSFYPESSHKLAREVNRLLATSPPAAVNQPAKMIIAPHAGYIYSGHVAAQAYSLLREHADYYQAVVLLGPSHRVGFKGIALPEPDRFETPLGALEVDSALLELVQPLPFCAQRNDAHALEHSLEVQLPFLQKTLSHFRVLPAVVGHCLPEQIAQFIEQLWHQPQVLFVISTDLSHFHTDQIAKRVDQETIDKIKALHSDLNGEQACGHYPLNGALLFARQHGLSIQEIARCNSGDISNNKESVVGYASFVLQ